MQTNAQHTLMRYKVRTNYEDKRINDALLQLESALAMDVAAYAHRVLRYLNYPWLVYRCFHGGVHGRQGLIKTNIAALKSRRRSMRQMTSCRCRRSCSADIAPERMADERFGSASPTLIILDGGLPQLNAVLEMFDEMGIHDIALAGLAKRDEELFVPWQETWSGGAAKRVGVAVSGEAGSR